eukprot:TRINITY_DN19105_c2_g1_i3.p2 TRINITY_DN19105_c2_g1~~TRINITY_DN19105_c2_g1_i3.p2  ORF type:complete len:189 (-),score=35.59 TRINITY_DN19105_c2_g1_i3:132-698(-)
MIGRAAYNDPWGCLSQADTIIYGEKQNACASRRQVVTDYCKYADSTVGKFSSEKNVEQGKQYPSIRALVIPLLNLFFGCKNSKLWKRIVDEKLQRKPKTVSEVVLDTLHVFDDEVLDEPPGGNKESTEDQICKFSLEELPQKINLSELYVQQPFQSETKHKRQKVDESQEEWIDMGGVFSTVDVGFGN